MVSIFSSRDAKWAVVSGLAVVMASLIGPAVVPLYDGVGFPDEPYQYVSSTGQTSTPSAVEQTIPKSALQNGLLIQSPETGPQVKVVFSNGAIALPDAAADVRLSIEPKGPSGQPSTGTIASNVYLISGTSSPGSPTFKNGLANVYLRLPQGKSVVTSPVVIYRTATGNWSELATEQTGADIYSASLKGWGEYALAINTRPSPGQTSKLPARQNRAPLLMAVLLGSIVIIIIAIRLVGRRHN